MEGLGELELDDDQLIARAKEAAEIAVNCLTWAIDTPDAARGLTKAAVFRAAQAKTLALEWVRRSDAGHACARALKPGRDFRAPELAEQCALLIAWVGRRQLDAGDGLRPFGRERGARPAG